MASPQSTEPEPQPGRKAAFCARTAANENEHRLRGGTASTDPQSLQIRDGLCVVDDAGGLDRSVIAARIDTERHRSHRPLLGDEGTSCRCRVDEDEPVHVTVAFGCHRREQGS